MSNEQELFGEAIGLLVHDIRNYLNTIIGYSSIIQNNINSNDKNLEYFRKIYSSGMMIEKLLTNVDDYLLNNKEIISSKLNLKEEIESIINSKKDLLDEKNINITRITAENADIKTSKDILLKIFECLLQFSVKGLRNIKSKNIEYAIIKNKDEIIFLYSDSSNEINIEGKYYNYEEILKAKRGLGILFLEKYISILKGKICYLYGRKWDDLKEKLKIETDNKHGFVIEIN